MNIHHIAIWAADLEQMKVFYQRYFHCSVSEKYVNLTKGFSSYFLIFAAGSKIELMHKREIAKQQGNVSTGYAHLAVNVGSRNQVDSLTQQMESDGIKIAGQPRITGDGYYESVVLDPEGNRIELLAE